MLWLGLLILIAGSSLFCGWLICKSHLNCRKTRTAQTVYEFSENSSLISHTAAECCSILASLEDHKTQFRNRLEMLNEMIEKSDREIERLQEQLARMDQLRTRPLDETSHDMLTLLRAGGFDEREIQHLTLRDGDELEDAA